MSTADMTQGITAQLRLTELTRAEDAANASLAELRELAVRWSTHERERRSLPTGIPESDVSMLRSVERKLQSLIERFGFGSYSPQLVGLDQEILRPEREGFNVDCDASASDVVRVKIAFLEAIRRQAAEQHSSPHPGFLVLDDPRQHDMNEDDCLSIVRTLADQGSGQTIVTTSSALELVEAAVGESSADVLDYGETRLLQAWNDPDPFDPM